MNHTGFFHHLTKYDPHMKAQHGATVPQIALLWLWSASFAVYLVRMTNTNFRFLRLQEKQAENEPTANAVKISVDSNGQENGNASAPEVLKTTKETRFSSVKPPPSFDQFLLHVIQLGVIMLFFYYSDYVKVFPRSERVYSRDTFLFVVFLLFLIGTAYTKKPNVDKILNREMTEEWKGWMQVMFVWYHYFAAAEWYNWIRIYIAAYVWMTGFGNFSFFWIKKDYSFWRMSKMLFRLNFLVLVICVAVSNPFMLYYICPMHTYWFLTVYLFMAVKSSWNEHRIKILIKFAVYAVANFIIFDIPGVTEKFFYPLWPLLGFDDGKHDIMHEWAFRLGLDHWVCFIGMLCAYNYPHFEAMVMRIEQNATLPMRKRWKEFLAKIAISVPVATVYIIWHHFILRQLDKYVYNSYHPYTSFIPVLAFIWFRNLFPTLRTYHIGLFATLGKITLETYLSQLHAYLQSNAKELVSYIDGYPLLNFSFNTIIYLGISHTLFTLTTDISAYLLPQDTKTFWRRVLSAVGALIISFILGAISYTYAAHIVPYL